MAEIVLGFDRLDRSSFQLVGGKGANLAEMTRAGFPVPAGFCVTTEAYTSFINQDEEMARFFEQLDAVQAHQLPVIAELGRTIREHLLQVQMPEAVRLAVVEEWRRTGKEEAYAVRSSATAEDLPTASFAGQQDTYLNVRGEEPLLLAIRRCWASLFTDRAISYRAKNGFDHRSVLLSVVVQRMVFPDVSGILFTADPITGHRGTVSIDASFGLGEALVSGLVSADLYQVRAGKILTKTIARKQIAIESLPRGGTVTREVPEDKQQRQALDDAQIVELAALGESIKRHYGEEQDIEWCYADGKLYVVQSRPITSLYPLPQRNGEPGEGLRLYLSFGHQQMMTDAIKPLGLSLLRTMLPFDKPSVREESRVSAVAGGRLYVDITDILGLKPARILLPKVIRHIDEQIGSGLEEFLRRDDIRAGVPRRPGLAAHVRRFLGPIAVRAARNVIYAPVDHAHPAVNGYMQASLEQGRARLAGKSGHDRVQAIQEHAGQLLRNLFPDLMPYPLAGIVSSRLLLAMTKRWLGDEEAIHVLNKSLPGNVTSEMGLLIGDLADLARPYPQVVELIRSSEPDRFREKLRHVEGGDKFGAAWDDFMDRYGMRCPGEIDVTRPRWRDDPGTLLPAIDSHLRSVQPGEHRAKFAQGAQEAETVGQELLERLRKQPFGWSKAKIAGRLLRVFRNLMGLREHPKYLMMRQFGLMREGLLEEGHSLAEAGILDGADDVFYLTLEELLQLTSGGRAEEWRERIDRRKAEFARFRTLTPPRLMTSEGEIVTGRRRRQDAPEGALLGTPVSSGVVEGVARIVMSPDTANLHPGEIMIAPFTDPGWTPLFHSAVGLVMEVGGLMTHGAVVAREYGLPAVVGIDGATRLIRDGDRVLLDGTKGYVLVLEHGNRD